MCLVVGSYCLGSLTLPSHFSSWSTLANAQMVASASRLTGKGIASMHKVCQISADVTVALMLHCKIAMQRKMQKKWDEFVAILQLIINDIFCLLQKVLRTLLSKSGSQGDMT